MSVLMLSKHFVSIVGFLTIMQGTWESTLLATWYGLYNGGTAVSNISRRLAWIWQAPVKGARFDSMTTIARSWRMSTTCGLAGECLSQTLLLNQDSARSAHV